MKGFRRNRLQSAFLDGLDPRHAVKLQGSGRLVCSEDRVAEIVVSLQLVQVMDVAGNEHQLSPTHVRFPLRYAVHDSPAGLAWVRHLSHEVLHIMPDQSTAHRPIQGASVGVDDQNLHLLLTLLHRARHAATRKRARV